MVEKKKTAQRRCTPYMICLWLADRSPEEDDLLDGWKPSCLGFRHVTPRRAVRPVPGGEVRRRRGGQAPRADAGRDARAAEAARARRRGGGGRVRVPLGEGRQ